MNKLKEFLFNYKNIIILLLVISSFLLFVIFYKEDNVDVSDEVIKISEKGKNEERSIDDNIYVDIKGAVKYPGVYLMSKGDRVIDVIKKSKIKKSGNTKYLNLSKKLEDEMVIVIYTNTEVKNYLNNKSLKSICSIMINNACLTDNSKSIDSVKDSSTTTTISANLDTSKSSNIENDYNKEVNNRLININTADLSLLMTLSGIGESKAKAIIAYREENGKFSDINDITNVSGIGTSIYEKIKNNITV